MASHVADPALAAAGAARIEWADGQMPVLRSIRERFAADRPLDGVRVAACLHVTAETANLVRTLMAGGAETALCAANPLSTQDDTAAALVERYGAEVRAVRGEDADAYVGNVAALVAAEPQITIDDGADLITFVHAAGDGVARAGAARRARGDDHRAHPRPRARGRGPPRLPGPRRQRGAHRARVQRPLRHRPVDARRHPARDEPPARRPHLRRARLRLDGPRRRAPRPRRGRVGHRLRGRPARARSRRGWRASRSCRRSSAAARGDVFVTVTGARDVLTREHFERMKDGAVLANAGHFDVEISVADLRELATGGVREVRPLVEQYDLGDRRLNLLAARPRRQPRRRRGPPGRGDGHVVRAAGAVRRGARRAAARAWRPPCTRSRPTSTARSRRLKLAALGVEIDTLTAEQAVYRRSWE